MLCGVLMIILCKVVCHHQPPPPFMTTLYHNSVLELLHEVVDMTTISMNFDTCRTFPCEEELTSKFPFLPVKWQRRCRASLNATLKHRAFWLLHPRWNQ